MNYSYDGRAIQIVPCAYSVITDSREFRNIAGQYPIYLHRKFLLETLCENVKITVGLSVPYWNIYKSYLSAMMADFYLRYFRKDKAILRFEEIRALRQLIKHDMTLLQADLEKKYQGLNRYESENNGFLLSTLRELVRSQFNYKAAAVNLHVHLNTLYYRQEKLSNLLESDLADLEVKITLYYELFAYDFMQFMKTRENHTKAKI